MKTLFLILPLLILAGCKTPCKDPGSIPSIASNFIIQKWECKNKTKVQSDITKWMADRNWCEESKGKTEILSGLICTFIGEKLRDIGVNKINDDLKWDCNPDLIGKDAAMAFIAICSQIPY